jgi:hypothetical protein
MVTDMVDRSNLTPGVCENPTPSWVLAVAGGD